MIASRIFYENKDSLAKILVNRGGAGSGKSYSLMQLHLYRFYTSEKAHSSLIIRKTSPSMRQSVLRTFFEISKRDFGIDPDKLRKEKQFLNYYYRDNLIHFGALDDPEKIKSTEWNSIWMEEATEFDVEDFRALRLRLRAPSLNGLRNQLFMSFNPVNVFHWIKKDVVDKEKDPSVVQEIISTYKDNLTLDPDYVKDLEATKDQDYNWYRVYALGEWGALENLIYPGDSYEIIPEHEWPESFEDTFYGLDFGFTHSETALTEINVLGDQFYEQEKIYSTHLTNSDIIELLNEVLVSPEAIIYADPASPDRIEELMKAGFNIVPFEKKIGSVISSIDCVKRHKIKIHEKSSNLLKEKQSYSFQKNRNGELIDVPIKKNDHLIDAERMAMLSHVGEVEPNVFFV